MSPVPAFGHTSYLIFGSKESAFDTYAAPTNGKKLGVLKWGVEPSIGVLPDMTLSGQLSPLSPVEGGSFWQGTFSVLLNFDGLLELFRACMGGYTAGSPIESSVRDHTFREATSATAIVEVLNSYSIDVCWGNIPAGKVYRLTGVKLLGFTIKGTAGNGNDGLITVEFDLWGRRLDHNAGAGFNPTTSGVTTPTVRRVPFYHPWLFRDGATSDSRNCRIRSFEVGYKPPHDTERYYLGTKLPDEPIRSDFLKPTWQITQELNEPGHLFVKDAFSASYSLRLILQEQGSALASHTSVSCTPQNGNTITRGAGSFITDGWVVGDHVNPSANGVDIPAGCYVTNVAALTLTVDGATTLGSSQTVTGGVSREIELRTSSAKLKSLSQPIDGYGPVIATAAWEGFYDAADFASLLVRIRNTEAALA